MLPIIAVPGLRIFLGILFNRFVSSCVNSLFFVPFCSIFPFFPVLGVIGGLDGIVADCGRVRG